MYGARAVGGALYIVGIVMAIYNIAKTVKIGSFINNEDAEAPPMQRISGKRKSGEGWHRWLERRPVQFLILSLIAILIGGLVEIIPTYLIKSNVPTIASVKPWTPLELQGRDIYVREGCYTCHSQMIRPFRSETERYGDYSKSGEFVYNHPFQFGSKRNGPDLSREGVVTGKQYKPNSWHFNHMLNPQTLNEQSIMPKYPWLIEDDLDMSTTERKINVMQYFGAPYAEGFAETANDHLLKQAQGIADNLAQSGIECEPQKEIIALIAYLQRLGVDITRTDSGTASSNK
jgi:cytochrome c oxidase cbb3-type subunit I/II